MVMLLPSVIPMDPVNAIEPEVVVIFPAVARDPPLLAKLILPAPVMMSPTGSVSVPPATAETPVLTPHELGYPSDKLFASTICTA